MKLEIRNIQASDWKSVAAIYKMGIETGIATFETKTPSWPVWDKAHIKSCRIAALINDKMVGWAALSPVSSRDVYRGVAEVSVYVNTNYGGRGIGTKLLQKLIIESENEGFWTLQSGIFPENTASLKMHKKLGFREIGYREKVGMTTKGVWRNNIILERRSKKIGV